MSGRGYTCLSRFARPITETRRPGLIRRRIRIADIRSAAAVRNRWYYGWRLRLTPHGWLYNVSGLNAVQPTRVLDPFSSRWIHGDAVVVLEP